MPVWNQLWNEVRLQWEQRFGRRHSLARPVLRDLHKALAERDAAVALGEPDRILVERIYERTVIGNRNNLTRTNAYLDFYTRNPEVHWAFLAHCVSRNGGYGMTDVQGEWFARTAKPDQKGQFFAFLERANWLIFQDAFPQLLLYEEGKRQGTNLSYLLPSFSVSRFMHPMWDRFWETRDSALLTRALIINEQNYIEKRVVKNPRHESAVEASIQFQVQSLLNLNQVLFPYRQGQDVRLAGTTVEHFTSIEDRIRTGLRLYGTLFQDKIRNRKMYQFACEVPHSASRCDYWPHVFTTQAPLGAAKAYEPHFDVASSKRTSGIYSPRLQDVWEDVHHEPAESGDWFHDLSHAIYLFEEIPKQSPDITAEYVNSIKTIETLIVAKEKAQAILPG